MHENWVRSPENAFISIDCQLFFSVKIRLLILYFLGAGFPNANQPKTMPIYTKPHGFQMQFHTKIINLPIVYDMHPLKVQMDATPPHLIKINQFHAINFILTQTSKE